MTATPVSVFSSTLPKLSSSTSTSTSKLNPFIFDPHFPPPFSSFSTTNNFTNRFTFRSTNSRKPRRRNPTPSVAAAMIFPQNPVFSDICATVFSGIVALSVLRVWQETAKRHLFDQKLNRKLVHISIGLVFMLCWPLFSSGYRGAILAAITPGVNVIRVLLIGSGIWKDEATVKAMSRSGDYRELLKGPLYYATTITLSCALYWRTSPTGIAAICNLCAGDGFADVVGRRFAGQKLPYNRNKSIAGSVAMATAGFFTSVG
ncbi:hypothetical protein REPUB_Repub11eG0189800 [Reevesia pubescens]